MSTRRLTIGLLVAAAVVGGALVLFHAYRERVEPGAAATPAQGRQRRAEQERIEAARRAPAASQAAARPRLTPVARARLVAALERAQAARGAGTQAGGSGSGGGSGGRPAEGATERDGGVAGALDKEYLRAAIRELVPLVKECYEHALRDQPDLGGRLTVEFRIAGEPAIGGVVTESRIVEADAGPLHAGLEECVRETMYGLQLDAPAGGGTVKVRYPFVFRSR